MDISFGFLIEFQYLVSFSKSSPQFFYIPSLENALRYAFVLYLLFYLKEKEFCMYFAELLFSGNVTFESKSF